MKFFNKRNIYKYILFIIVFSFYLYLNLNYRPYPDEDELKRYETMKSYHELINKYPAPIIAKDITGNKINILRNIGKKIIILNFFGTWCKPCKDEMPEFNRFYEKSDKELIELVGICVSEENDNIKITIEEFVKKYKVRFPIYEYIKGYKQFNLKTIPSTVVIGVNGKVHFVKKGAISNADIAFKKTIEKNITLIKENKTIDYKTYLKERAHENE